VVRQRNVTSADYIMVGIDCCNNCTSLIDFGSNNASGKLQVFP
jgi:hypothetical protein